MKVSFQSAMVSYAVLACVAGVALDGKIRLAVWIFLVAFALKTWIARAADW